MGMVPRNEDSGTGIIATYHERGIRRKVRAQLEAMHAAGLRSLRVLIWHSVEGDQFGMVSSQSGRLQEPYRSNLIRYLTDIREAGFESLIVGFAPEGPNNPMQQYEVAYASGATCYRGHSSDHFRNAQQWLRSGSRT